MPRAQAVKVAVVVICFRPNTLCVVRTRRWFIFVIISFHLRWSRANLDRRVNARFKMDRTLLGILRSGQNHMVVTTALHFLRAFPLPDSSPHRSLWSLQMLFREE